MSQEVEQINTNKPLYRKVERVSELMSFVDWVATPHALREIKTQKEFAVKYDIHETTLVGWKDRAGFWDEVKDRTISWGRQRTPNVVAALYRNAIQKGNAQEAKMWLQYVEGWKEKTEVDQRNLHKHVVITRGENEIHESDTD